MIGPQPETRHGRIDRVTGSRPAVAPPRTSSSLRFQILEHRTGARSSVTSVWNEDVLDEVGLGPIRHARGRTLGRDWPTDGSSQAPRAAATAA